MNRQPFLMVAAVALVVMSLAAPAALADIAEVGPIDPVHGFPTWVKDTNGVKLVIAPASDPLSIAAPVIPGNAFSEAIGFGDEGFWWSAEAQMTLANGSRVLLVVAQEAAFSGAGGAVDGNQFCFGRLRLRLDDPPVAGTYKFIHPYGEHEFTTEAGERIVFTDDNGDLTPFKNDGRVLRSAIGPFLVAVDPPPPEGYVGNPGVDARVQGSPTGFNKFRLEGPPGSNLDGQGNNFIETDLFSVSGKLAPDDNGGPGDDDPPVDPPADAVQLEIVSATVATTAATMTLNISATADADATVVLNLGAGLNPVTLNSDGAGNFSATVNVPRAVLVQVPVGATLAATPPENDPRLPAQLPVTFVDTLTATATLRVATGLLTISARSSLRRAPLPTFSAVGFGNFSGGLLIVRNVFAPPATVTIESSAGGSITVPIVNR